MNGFKGIWTLKYLGFDGQVRLLGGMQQQLSAFKATKRPARVAVGEGGSPPPRGCNQKQKARPMVIRHDNRCLST